MYLYIGSTLSQTSEGITSNSMLLGSLKISIGKIEAYLWADARGCGA